MLSIETFIKISRAKLLSFTVALSFFTQLLSAQKQCMPLREGWYFTEEKINTGLSADTKMMDSVISKTVFLPHKIWLPNNALWYKKNIQLDEPALMKVVADDGAQVWLNHKRILPDDSGQYLIEADKDSSTLFIRVLNNAMAGGLKSVCMTDTATGFAKLKALQNRDLGILADSALLKLSKKNIQLIEARNWDTTGEISFSAWGDSQGGWDTFSMIQSQILKHPHDFSIGLGDLTANGSDLHQWQSLFHHLGPLLRKDIPIFLIPGNHDYDGYSDNLKPLNYLKFALGNENSNSWFSWQAGDAYFIALDQNVNFPLGFGKNQMTWLLEQFNSEGWKKSHWHFLLVHQPPLGQGWKGYYGDEPVRAILNQYAEQYQIDFILSGHIHDYERLSTTIGKQKTHLFILGGAGGSLEPPGENETPIMDTLIKRHHFGIFNIRKNEVEVKIFDSVGNQLDYFVTKK